MSKTKSVTNSQLKVMGPRKNVIVTYPQVDPVSESDTDSEEDYK